MATAHSSLPDQIDISNIDIQWSPPQAPPSASSSDSPHRSGGSGRSSPMSLSRRATSSSLLSESSRNSASNSFLACTSNRSRSPDNSLQRQRQQQRSKPQSSTVDIDGRHKINVDPYKILGVDRGATKEDIKIAYKRLALLSHPRRTEPRSEINSTRENCDNMSSTEESVREWQFIVVAASYETLSVSEHRKEYDCIWKRSQIGPVDAKKKKFGKKRGFWTRFKKGLEISDSFDKDYQGKNLNDNSQCCSANSEPPLSSFCGSSTTIRSGEIKYQRDTEVAIAQMQSSRSGKKLLLDCKPLLLSDDEASNRQKSTGTESIFTEDGNEDTIREETDHLFGGPLATMYKARQYQPFYDAFGLFRKEFGSDIFKSKSCFDDEDEDENATDTDGNFNISQQWVSGGTGRILNDSNLVSHVNVDNQLDVSGLSFSYNNAFPKSNEPKIALVYPVLPNIPLETLKMYGILDGSMKMVVAQEKPNNNNNNKDNTNSSDMKVQVTRETSDGISLEVKTTTKIHGNKRIVRTQTTTINSSSGHRKTVTSVRKESIHEEERIDAAAVGDERDDKRHSFFELVPCCSYSLPSPTDTDPIAQQSQTTKVQVRDDESTTPSPPPPLQFNHNSISKTNFENKKELKQRMKNLFLAQQRTSRQQDPFNTSSS